MKKHIKFPNHQKNCIIMATIFNWPAMRKQMLWGTLKRKK